MTLTDWIDVHLLDVQNLTDTSLEIDGRTVLIVSEKDPILRDGLRLGMTFDEDELWETGQYDAVLFRLGSQFYICPSPAKVELTTFKYIGKAVHQDNPPFLGVHGPHQICDGSRQYVHWCQKAKFLGIDTLGICEENTIAGWVEFYTACEKNGIKPVLGVTLILPEGAIKLYLREQSAYENLITLVNYYNLSKGEVSLEGVCSIGQGISCVLGHDFALNEQVIHMLKESFDTVHFQLDLSQWEADKYDEKILSNYQSYFTYFKNILPLLYVPDAYFLDSVDYKIRKKLHDIGKIGYKNTSRHQYFKSFKQSVLEAGSLFADEETIIKYYEFAKSEAKKLGEGCKVKLPFGTLHLPKYELSDSEKKLYSTPEELFWDLIEQGFAKKVPAGKESEYLSRLETELETINSGELMDYFLVLNGVIRFCKEKNIWVGPGRGSAAGAAICWLLDITSIDPIKYGLLFTRFLNPARVRRRVQEDYIVLNDKVEIKSNATVTIIRNGNTVQLEAREIGVGDEVISY